MSEYNFVTKFVSCYIRQNGLNSAIQPKGKNQSKNADCEVVRNNEIIMIEAKLLKDNRSNSTHFYNLVGELIGTSHKGSLLQNNGYTTYQKCGAFLIPSDSKTVFDDLWQKNISPNNGINYCNDFAVKYLILFDMHNGAIKFLSYCTVNNRWV